MLMEIHGFGSEGRNGAGKTNNAERHRGGIMRIVEVRSQMQTSTSRLSFPLVDRFQNTHTHRNTDCGQNGQTDPVLNRRS